MNLTGTNLSDAIPSPSDIAKRFKAANPGARQFTPQRKNTVTTSPAVSLPAAAPAAPTAHSQAAASRWPYMIPGAHWRK